MRKGIITLKCLVMAAFVALCGCSDPNELKTASKDFTPSQDLLLEDYIAAADSMAFFSCDEATPLPEGQAFNPLAFSIFQTRLKRDFDDLTEALKYSEREKKSGIHFDKQWTAYYVELYRDGKPIDTTRINATFKTQGYIKNGYVYYFADKDRVAEFFESRNIRRMPWGCTPEKRGQKSTVPPMVIMPDKSKGKAQTQPMVFKRMKWQRKR